MSIRGSITHVGRDTKSTARKVTGACHCLPGKVFADEKINANAEIYHGREEESQRGKVDGSSRRRAQRHAGVPCTEGRNATEAFRVGLISSTASRAAPSDRRSTRRRSSRSGGSNRPRTS